MMKVIGVIGGGAAGLCAARHILAAPGLSPVVWEKAHQIGGTWVYDPNTGTDQHGLPIHSSMYENLKTNLPKEVMGFPDYPFPSDDDESFIHHTKVLKYLENYAEHFNLKSHIKFGHHVELVKPFVNEDKTSWEVKTVDLTTQSSTTTICDAIFVCNGHYSVPRMPQVKDIEKYTGKQIHSHDYREPSPYKNSTVVVLGAAASGLDISLEVASVAKEVIISHNLPVKIPSTLPPNVRQVPGVVSAKNDGFVFGDGSSAKADVIMYCTGYEFTFPFLAEDCDIRIEDNTVKSLYKHIINTTHPTMGFIGIPFQVCPFPLFDFQIRYFVAVLTGDVVLPSTREMVNKNQAILQSQQSRGIQDKHYHKLGLEYEPYLIDLAKEMKASSPPPYHNALFKISVIRLVLDLLKFKQYKYEIIDGQLKETLNGVEINTKWDIGYLGLCRLAALLWQDFPGVCRFVFGFLKSKLV